MADFRICSIPNCDKPAKTRGWCNIHYQRWVKHGDALAGKPKDFDASRFYSDVVSVYAGEDCLTWPFHRTIQGYAQMWHDGHSRDVHRRLCTETHGEPPTPHHQAAHSCGKGHEGCVSKQHLSWKTQSANNLDKIDHGTALRGSKVWASKLTEANVLHILSLKGKMRQIDIANLFGVTKANISQIHLRKTWAWLSPPTNISEKHQSDPCPPDTGLSPALEASTQ